MEKQNDWTPFSWLDKNVIERIVRYAVGATNERIQQQISDAPEVWAVTPRLCKANTIRSRFVGHINSACTAYDDIIVARDEQNIAFLQLLSGQMLQIGKTLDPNLPPIESKILRKARLDGQYLSTRQQDLTSDSDPLQLFLPSLEMPQEQQNAAKKSKTPLALLQQFVLAYRCEGDCIVAVYIQDVDREHDKVRHYVELDLSELSTEQTEEPAPSPQLRPSFSFKKHDKENEEEDIA